LGHDEFRAGARGGNDLADNGFPIGDSMSRAIAGSQKLKKYPSSAKVYLPANRAPKPGELFRNPDLARTLRRLVEARSRVLPKIAMKR